jgi:hypothetical protein
MSNSKNNKNATNNDDSFDEYTPEEIKMIDELHEFSNRCLDVNIA